MRACGVERSGYDDEIVTITLGDRLPTRQVCRLTGHGGRNGPYHYAGQDSAITVPWVRARDGIEREDVLWWFGDTTDVSGGEIFVPNKMAASDGDADAADDPLHQRHGASGDAQRPDSEPDQCKRHERLRRHLPANGDL